MVLHWLCKVLLIKINIMGWGKIQKNLKREVKGGIKFGCWNKGGALQPLKEKLNEIELLIKTEAFGVFGVLEANLFKHDDVEDIKIDGYTVLWDKGRDHIIRNNARTVVYVRNDLSFQSKEELMESNVPEVWLEVGEPKKKLMLICF